MERYSVVAVLVLLFFGLLPTKRVAAQNEIFPVEDSTGKNPYNLPYNFNDESGLLLDSTRFHSPLMMETPDLLKKEVEYDPDNNRYIIRHKLGDKINYKAPRYLSVEDYLEYDLNNFKRDYWKQRARSENFEHKRALIPQLHIGSKVFETIFGSNTIDIKPRGEATLDFGLKYNKTDNPQLAEEQRSDLTFDFDERIQMNVTGKIGENLSLKLSYDTEASFEFENEMNIRYQGNEDDIIQRIEAGNVSLPLSGTLIQGSQNLFGILTEMKFGKLNITTLFSQQKSETKNITVEGGATKRRFEVQANEYDDKRHYFLAHYFRENYEEALKDYPLIRSNVRVDRIEVWVLNKNNMVENTRNIVAFSQLAENTTPSGAHSFPQNGTLYNNVNNDGGIRNIASAVGSLESMNFQNGTDFEVFESARKLDQTEYTFNPNLGYISLNSKLRSDEIVAVAYDVQVQGESYSVGEMTTGGGDSDSTLIVKLLKPTSFSPNHPTWDLMMKNIYKLDAYNISREDFMLNVMYNDVAIGTDVFSLPTENENLRGKNLLKVLNLDRLNTQNQRVENGDGMFDFAEGITINSSKGYVIFPVLEPFGNFLRRQFGDTTDTDAMSQADQFVYDVLYDSTKTFAEQISEKNKFSIGGSYKSSAGSEIPLNAINIPKGSVKVTAGGRELTEGVDYTVDYYLGRVKILDEGLLQSQTPINISLESNTMFSIQSKTLLGTTLEYRVNEDLLLGGSLLNLTERPLTQKVNVGNEPISNTIWGFNVNYEKEVPFLTKMVDKLPFIETKAPSKITATAEFAHLIPGHNKAIKHKGEAFLDDFEGATADITMKEPYYWFLASTPKRFNEDYTATGDDIYNYTRNRAQLSWYFIDPTFYEGATPVSDEAISNLNAYEVKENQIFPNRDPEQGIYNTLSVFNLSFFPNERGPYNFDDDPTNIDQDGKFTNPEERWAGIQRNVRTSDFEEANIEFIEFWMMDPYAQDEEDGITRDDPDPALFINLGNISEDVLKDYRRSFENGLDRNGTTDGTDTTAWGIVSNRQVVSDGFDDVGRDVQDVGYDGLTNTREREFFVDNQVYSEAFLSNLTPEARAELEDDPAQDDYHYYKGGGYESNSFFNNNIINRYRYFTNPHGNSPASTGTESQMQTSLPNNEDINNDNTLNQVDAYYEYKIDLSPENLDNAKKYIVDENDVTVSMPDGSSKTVTWYQFKVPVRDPDFVEGNISDFRSIRFMRMYLTGFNRDVTLRFAELNLIRGEWRKYRYVLEEGGEVVDDDIDLSNAQFDVGTVNVEENGQRTPVNYVLPPDVDRVIDPSNSQMRQLNEQSISMKVRDLPDGFAKAIYKNIRFDMRQYKRLKMYIHAEELEDVPLEDNELSVFVRLGTDIKENYYEYEIPVVLTPPGNYTSAESDRQAVWPIENELNIPLAVFTDTKKERNDLIGDAEAGVSLLTEYLKQHGKNTVKVRGNPNLAEVVTFTIGVRNPRNDHQIHSGEIWVNELRLTEFDEEGGWAANARLTAQLADLGTVTLAGATSKPGFGGIEQKLNERQLNEIYQYDVNTSLQLGQFFPEDMGVKIPMYVGYAETFTNPKYNPLAKDIEFDKSLEGLSPSEQDELKKLARKYNMRRSINFTGVRFGKQKKDPHFYDLNNWSFSYSYNQNYNRDVNLAYHNQQQHTGSINYIYNNRTEPWEPFKNADLNSNYFGLIKDFNINYAPSQVSFSSVVSRKYNKMKRRNLNIPDQVFQPTYDKNFTWNRNYGLVYNLSKSIKVNFDASAIARIDEPEGKVERGMPKYDSIRNDIMEEFYQLGTMTQYNQNIAVTYQLPLSKIPGLKWINATAGYTGTYDWNRGPELNTDIEPGHSIQNNNTINGGANLAFDRLFKQSQYISDIHRKFKKPLSERFDEKIKYEVTYEKREFDLEAGDERTIFHRLGTEDVTIKLVDAEGNDVEMRYEVDDDRRIILKPENDLEDVSLVVTGKKQRSQGPLQIMSEYFVRIGTGLKSARMDYTQNNGSIMHGISSAPNALGMSFRENDARPGWEYVFGLSDPEFMERALKDDWLEDDIDSTLIEPYTMTFQENMSVNGTYIPLNGLEIKLKAQWARTRNTDRYYYSDTYEGFQPSTPTSVRSTGNWSMSVWTFSSAFDKMDDREYTNDVYREFLSNRKKIAQRLAAQRAGVNGYDPNDLTEGGYPDGYPSYSQDVVVPAFIAAYVDGTEVNNVALSVVRPIFSLLRPDWRIDYDGFMQFGVFKNNFRNFKLQHSYKAVFTMGGYTNNPSWSDLSENDPNNDGLSFIRSQQDTSLFVTRNSISQITISEDFLPFFEVNMTWKSNVTTRLAFNKRRTLSLNTSNNNVAESRRNELVIGSGYRFDNLTLVFRTRGGGQRKFNSPVELRADFSIADDVKYVHKPDSDFTELVDGKLVYKFGFTANYRFSKNLELRGYLDYTMTEPKMSPPYKTTVLNFGFSFKFRLVDTG
ncbi:T9SS outer membrane translocon Sov/SprA [Salinivirga cyanobacteriivorans]